MATAIFTDIYAGPTEMKTEAFKTSRAGIKVTRYRWISASPSGSCITTGFSPAGFTSEAQAVASARRHRGFSEVKETC